MMSGLHHDNVPAHDKQKLITTGLSTIFTRFGPVQLLTVPKTEYQFEGSQISRHDDSQGHSMAIPKSISQKGF
jgi:hypothetical protein